MVERALEGQRFLLTNVEPGAGLHVPRELLRRGASLTITCRTTKLAEQSSAGLRGSLSAEAWPRIEAWALDPCDLDAVRTFVRAFKRHHSALHAIVHGTLHEPGAHHAKVAFPTGADQALTANHLAPFLLTQLMLPILINSAPARIVLATDFAHGAGDPARLRALSTGDEVAPPRNLRRGAWRRGASGWSAARCSRVSDRSSAASPSSVSRTARAPRATTAAAAAPAARATASARRRARPRTGISRAAAR